MTGTGVGPITFPEMEDANPLTTIAAIEAFELQRNLTLPPLYKEFLLELNGGTPKHPTFPVRGLPGGFELIQSFAGIGVREPTNELAWAYDLFVGGFPHGIVPIAGNGTGSYICLDLRGGKERVAFWNKRHF